MHGRLRMIKPLALPLTVFAKSAACPSAEGLLEFSRSQLEVGLIEYVASHLEQCDFCRAELQLLERFPCKPEVVPFAEMPASLRRLAESILRNPDRTQRRNLPAMQRGLSH